MQSDYRLKGASGVVFGKTWQLTNDTLIGAAEDCDIRVGEPGIAPHHAMIRLGEGRAWVENLAKNDATYVNEAQVNRQELSPGDEVRVGGCRLMFQAPGLRPGRVIIPAETGPKPRRWLLPLLTALLLAGLVALVWYYR